MNTVQLCNNALGALGARSTIASLTEDSNEARACSRLFEQTRDECLSKAWWNFARKTTVLTLLKSSVSGYTVWTSAYPAPPWTYEYACPADAIAIRYLEPMLFQDSTNVPIFSTATFVNPPLVNGVAVKFIRALGTDSSGNQIPVILTNQPQAIATYSAVVTDPNLWDAEFVVTVTYALAGYLAMALTGDKQLASSMFSIANEKLREAMTSDANEGLTIQESIPDWLKVRGVGYANMDTGGPFGLGVTGSIS